MVPVGTWKKKTQNLFERKLPQLTLYGNFNLKKRVPLKWSLQSNITKLTESYPLRIYIDGYDKGESWPSKNLIQ